MLKDRGMRPYGRVTSRIATRSYTERRTATFSPTNKNIVHNIRGKDKQVGEEKQRKTFSGGARTR